MSTCEILKHRDHKYSALETLCRKIKKVGYETAGLRLA